MPRPACEVPPDARTWKNSSKMRARCSGAMPIPVSTTSMTTTASAAAGADDDTAGARVANRVRNQVAQDARQQRRIAVDGEARAHGREPQALRLGLRRELLCDLAEQRPERDACAVGDEHAGFELRQVDQLAELRFQRLERLLHAGHEQARVGLDPAARRVLRRTARRHAAADADRGSRRRAAATWRGSPLPLPRVPRRRRGSAP